MFCLVRYISTLVMEGVVRAPTVMAELVQTGQLAVGQLLILGQPVFRNSIHLILMRILIQVRVKLHFNTGLYPLLKL